MGQRMFHSAGYDAVGLTALTDALGINPPSFYAAFGNKARFFERVLERYASMEMPLADFLQPGRPPAEALADLLERAAHAYARDPEIPGCLVLDAARGNHSNESAMMARKVVEGRRAQVRAFVAEARPEVAGIVTDFVSMVMAGLSASAREGMEEARLVAVSRAAACCLDVLLT